LQTKNLLSGCEFRQKVKDFLSVLKTSSCSIYRRQRAGEKKLPQNLTFTFERRTFVLSNL